MLNPISAYAECGKRAAIARNEGDEARCEFESYWAIKALSLEKHEDRAAARDAWTEGYKAHRIVPPVDYFR